MCRSKILLLINFRSLDAKFIADASLPDDSVVRYGKGFSKSWLVENTGTKQWQNVQLIHQDGFLPIQSEVDIPDLVPGEQVYIDNTAVTYFILLFRQKLLSIILQSLLMMALILKVHGD